MPDQRIEKTGQVIGLERLYKKGGCACFSRFVFDIQTRCHNNWDRGKGRICAKFANNVNAVCIGEMIVDLKDVRSGFMSELQDVRAQRGNRYIKSIEFEQSTQEFYRGFVIIHNHYFWQATFPQVHAVG